MRSVISSSTVGPPPERARSIAVCASRYTARTSVPSTTTPSNPYAGPRAASEEEAKLRCVGVE